MELRKFISLSIQNIVNRSSKASFIPQVPLTSLIRPGTRLAIPATSLTHFTRGVCFESVQRNFRFSRSDRDNSMHMICPHVDCQQGPLSNSARFINSFFNIASLRRIQNHNFAFEALGICFEPFLFSRQTTRFVLIAKAIDRSAFVAMQPRSIRAKRDQEGHRNIGVVPHCGCRECGIAAINRPLPQAVLTSFTSLPQSRRPNIFSRKPVKSIAPAETPRTGSPQRSRRF
jgi:hypothetical protein